MGIDGRIYPVSAMPKKTGKAAGELGFMDDWYPIQVKQKDKVGRPDINSFFRKEHKVIIPLTVKEILEQNIAPKLA